jgi:branched-chain amino acid transport system ATP-binding protein
MTLQITRLRARYGRTTVLRDVDLELVPGSVLALIGANGMGKSTLLRSVAGLHRSASGSVTLDGTEMLGRPAHRIAALGLGLVPEGRHLFPELTVQENLQMGLHGQGCSAAEAKNRIAGVLEQFPILGDFSQRSAGALSGGQQQMLAIGRALVRKPSVLLLDEPSLGLAPLLVAQILQTARTLADAGVAVLLAEQNAAAALRVADTGAVMENGRITRLDPARTLLQDDDVSRHYLGGSTIGDGGPATPPRELPEELRTAVL